MWGVDYSDEGLALAQANLDRAGVTATLVKADVRDAHALPEDHFDVVYSLGLIEHFEDPSYLLSILSRVVRPGGILITLVPNYSGVWGAIQRYIDPGLLAVHTVYDHVTLDSIHEQAGLSPIERARYFGGCGPLVVNYTRRIERLPTLAQSAILRSLWIVQQVVSWTTSPLPMSEGRQFASHLAAVYARPATVRIRT
jgi:2-polyprenyl-6-hydroxyphenyl methylase/3-demethylubiquinone-9 3-methyltransferase